MVGPSGWIGGFNIASYVCTEYARREFINTLKVSDRSVNENIMYSFLIEQKLVKGFPLIITNIK